MPSNLKTYVPGKCPNCGQKAKPVVYGLIASEPDEDFVRGGCCISGIEPDFFCVDCNMEFGYGGRNYETKFDLEFEYTNNETGETKRELRNINLVESDEEELLTLAPWLIEARHELLHREFPAQEMALIALQGNWKSFPMEALADFWVYWSPATRKIYFGVQYFAEGIKHLHALYRPDLDRAKRVSSFDDFQSLMATKGLRAWNLKSPLPKRGRTIPEHELVSLMIAEKPVPEALLFRFANPVPDSQMWPGWYSPSQEFHCD